MSKFTFRRVAIVSETYEPDINGVANTLKYMVDGISERTQYLQIIIPKSEKYSKPFVEGKRHTVTVRGFPIPKYTDLQFGAPSVIKLWNLWSTFPPSVIYIATEGPLGWAANFVAKRLNIPVVSGFHTNFHAYSRYYGMGILEKITTAYLRNFHNNTQKTLVPTQQQQSYLSELGFNNVEIFARGVDCERFSPKHRSEDLRQTWGLSEDETAVIYVGRLAAEKNIALAVKAFREIENVNNKAKFILVGDGPLRESLEADNPDFIFCGMQQGEPLSQHYASGDLFLFPSRSETFGNVVIEAMASKLAIVGFDYAAARSHLVHGENGLLAELESDEEFIQQAIAAAKDSALIQKLRDAARAKAESISWPEMINLFESQLLTTMQRFAPKNRFLTTEAVMVQTNQ